MASFGFNSIWYLTTLVAGYEGLAGLRCFYLKFGQAIQKGQFYLKFINLLVNMWISTLLIRINPGSIFGWGLIFILEAL
jgi:hypothetical protein